MMPSIAPQHAVSGRPWAARSAPRAPTAGFGRAERQAIVHLILPGALVLALIVACSAGGPTRAALVAPTVNGELGLLEHLQPALLAAVTAAGA